MNRTARRKILLVEDEVVTTMVESQVISHHGYDVVTAGSGKEAIDILHDDPSVSLVLMDIDLGPGIDGTEASRQILAIKNIPIVFLTSHSEQEMAERLQGITYYGYVLKNAGDFVLLSTITIAFELFHVHENKKDTPMNTSHRPA